MHAVKPSVVAVVVASALALALPVAAQRAGVQQVASPFQAGYAYRTGETLDPGVSIDGIRWDVVHVRPRQGEVVTPGQPAVVEIDLRFDNQSERGGRMLVILLFETQRGDSLGRIEFTPMKIRPGKATEETQRFRLDGAVLESTRRLYLFAELQ